MSLSGTIFNIQRFSIHDGPGIRTTVFFKGCPLRCFWCHNPEGLRKVLEIQFEAERCIGCGECVRVCPEGAQELADGVRIYHRDRCVVCGECVETCFAGGLQKVGQEIGAEQILAEALIDRAFYTSSGGGVTLSGGEPMLQPSFALKILEGCRAAGLHTALETTTHYRWETLAEALPLTNLFMIDIKHINPEKHRAATGVSNERILANIRQLSPTGKPIIFRTPVVPGVNDTVEEIGAIADFVRKIAETPLDDGSYRPERVSLELLAFHKLAADKYRSLGLEYPAAHLEPPTNEQMAVLVKSAAARGIAVKSR
jgi:pyruvate formate lyase activating enzyme